MSRTKGPRLLELFACAGLAGDGYQRAGWRVYAVDNDPKALAHNPHPHHLGNALAVLTLLLLGFEVPFTDRRGRVEWLRLEDFDAIHASPPCQLFSATRNLAAAQGKGKGRAIDLLTPLLPLLRATGLPWVVENVERSPLKAMPHVRLCGSSWGLKVQRHRLFVSEGFDLTGTECDHAGAWDRDPRTGKPRPWGVYYTMGDAIPDGGRTVASLEDGHAAMGVSHRVVPWTYLCEGLPPVYTERLGRAMLEQVAA